jgi:two-component system phosphate regulon sensor histidine kinase PhoR
VSVIKKQKVVSDLKTDFINHMTHEFKTPIATISLASEALNEPSVLADESKINRFVKVIFDENNRLKNQVEKVLQFAKIDKGEWQLQKVLVDLNQLTEEIVGSFTLQVQEKHGEIDYVLEADQAVINADRVHIKNILSNLIDNAMKYCDQEPDIKVYTKSNNKGVFLTVSDNGIGMTKEEQQKVFDKFYRVSQGNVHDVKGFGLGLSYVMTMTKAHHGTIKVKSQKGKGSTFELFFPYEQNNTENERD